MASFARGFVAEGDVCEDAEHHKEEDKDARIKRYPGHAVRVLLQVERLLGGHCRAGRATGRVARVQLGAGLRIHRIHAAAHSIGPDYIRAATQLRYTCTEICRVV